MANDFTDDPNCVALWRFESGAAPFLADSIGTNEPLVDYGTVAEDTANYKEGACSADFGGSQSFHIDDADLDAGFPLKNGDTTKKISVCGWYRPDVITGDNRGVFAKGDAGAGTMSVRAMYLTAVGGFSADLFYSGADSENLINTGTAQTGRWYHFGFTWHDTNKSWRLVVWDDTDSTKVVNSTGVAVHNINVAAGPVVIGCGDSFGGIDYRWKFDGQIDEIVVFNDILSAGAIDLIRQGKYSWAAAHGNKFFVPILRMIDQQRSGA